MTAPRAMVAVLCVLVLFGAGYAQSGQIQGRVIDNRTKAPLFGANVSIAGVGLGSASNAQGKFIIDNVPTGDHEVRISFVGYKTESISAKVETRVTTELEVALQPTAIPQIEVVVTSERYEKQLRNVSVPLSVVQEKKITETSPTTVANVLQSEPGLALARDGIWSTHVSIRGLSKTNIVTLVDGNRVDTATDLAAGLSLVDVNDVQRIEVIKGAASSLYGTGAVGGVINIITKDGWYGDKFYTRALLQGGYGSVNNGGMGYATLNLGASNWYFKMSGLRRNAGNTKTPQGTLANSQYKDDNLSARVGVKPRQNQEVRLNYQRYYAEDVGIPGGYPLFPNNADVRYPQEKREMFGAEYVIRKLSASLARLTFKYYLQNILRDTENIPHTVQNVPATGGQPAKRISVLRINPGATHDLQGVQAQSDWIIGGHQHLIVGLDGWQKDLNGYRTRETKTEVLNAADGSVMQTISKTIGEQPLPKASYRSIGLFGQDEIPLLKNRLTFLAGGRIDQINVENEQVLNPVYEITDGVRNDSPANQKVLWNATQADDRSWSGNIGLVLQASQSLSFTLTAAKSFRSPYLEERYQYIDLGNLVKIGDPNLKPERGLFGDFGIRYYLSAFAFSGNVFINKLNDLVVEVPSTFEGRAALKKANVGAARLYGFDARAVYQPLAGIGVYGSASFVRGEDTYTETPLPLISPLNGRLGITSNFGGYLSLEFSATMFAEQNRVASGELKTPGYTYFDFYANLKSLAWWDVHSSFYFGVENMTNKSFRNHLATNRGFITAEPGRNFSFKWQVEI